MKVRAEEYLYPNQCKKKDIFDKDEVFYAALAVFCLTCLIVCIALVSGRAFDKEMKFEQKVYQQEVIR